MFRQSKKASPLRFSDLIRGDLSVARIHFKRKYRQIKRKYYLFIFLPAVLLAVGYRAAEEYAGLKRLQARKPGGQGVTVRKHTQSYSTQNRIKRHSTNALRILSRIKTI